MRRIEKKLKQSDEKFKHRTGTTKAVFQTMLDVLRTAHDKLHEQGGKPPDLTVGSQLLIALKYYWEYTTIESILEHRPCEQNRYTLRCSLCR